MRSLETLKASPLVRATQVFLSWAALPPNIWPQKKGRAVVPRVAVDRVPVCFCSPARGGRCYPVVRHGCPWSIGCGDPRSQKQDLGPFAFFRHGACRRRRTALDFFGRLRDDRGRGLEAYFGVGSVAEGLVGGCTTATERDGGFAGKIDFFTVGVNQLDGTFYAKWSVWSDRDGYFTLSHEHPSSEICKFDLSLAASDAEFSRCRGSEWLWGPRSVVLAAVPECSPECRWSNL
jgi:hypothetical protein